MTNPIADPSLQLRDVDGEVVVYDPASKKVHVMNASAGLVLRLCDGAHCAAAIAARLSGPDKPEGRALADVERILNQFEEMGLIAARAGENRGSSAA